MRSWRKPHSGLLRMKLEIWLLLHVTLQESGCSHFQMSKKGESVRILNSAQVFHLPSEQFTPVRRERGGQQKELQGKKKRTEKNFNSA